MYLALLPALFMMSGCADDEFLQQAKDGDGDAAYCVCNPCDPDLTWTNAPDGLNPKLDCYEECRNSSISNISYRDNYDIVYTTLYPNDPIPLADQAQILSDAYQVALLYRPSGKSIMNIELIKVWIGFPTVYYKLYPRITYANCTFIGVED